MNLDRIKEPNFSQFETIKSFLLGENDGRLFSQSDEIRRKVFGDDVFIRGIVEFSNHCKQNCSYCGLRAPNKEITRYRLTREEILHCVKIGKEQGIQTIVLQSGEDPYFSDDWIAELISEIKLKYSIAITLSLGERNFKTYKLWKDAGADRYLLRIETFDREVYENARKGHRWNDRLKCVQMLHELGFETGSGFMVGLPGETVDSLANSILELTKLNLDMIGIGPFVAHPETPFKNQQNGNVLFSLRTLAIIRILNPLANIPSTSALESAQKGARLTGLKVGANVIMPSLTPERVKALYNIYPGKNAVQDETEYSLKAVREMIREAGLRWSDSVGVSPNWLNHNQIL
ncbi:MAG: [FeFe] hydrogenase H-cluster radical SAM maturase HydE [Candidatus Marinimicrobia bacterium CG08_land_8_20_14_0_20_45_22]|nr:MAG: [FeFe] hydrogenase H-cluster radical SAM maturase HydE [Candidatus Marinimicrobia bacterium CG08_land_8_20_14_0_20_45_22]